MGMSAFGDPDRLYKDVLSDFFEFGNKKNPFYVKHNLHKGCISWKPELHSQKDLFDSCCSNTKFMKTFLKEFSSKQSH